MAIDGDDLMRALGLPPGPVVGRLLNDLFAAITDDPTRNRREELLALASDLLPGAREQRDSRRPGEAAE